MTELPIRKEVLVDESTYSAGGRECPEPIQKVAAVAVLENPYAQTWQEDLSLLMDWGAELGERLTATAAEQIGSVEAVESYGAAGVVGTGGELEHVAALLHPKLGGPVREVLGGGDAIIPSVKKRAGPGTTLDVPLSYMHNEYVRSHFDGMEVHVGDAPAPDEILVVMALADGGRPHPRIGGLTKEEADN